MTNPFENPDGTYVVLVNDENQHSLWPVTVDQPAGWTVAHPSDTREACLSFIEENWTDMRPRSLAQRMADK
ncbi:MbtH family protein [Streptomyces atriruber]|uniref:MbtH family protein n=1 Tax=Streptomyces atriruber TaxID=545121 RepID=A0ABV3BQR7_9ACTN|nr:MbtH family protein [Streptomyces sp. KL118A]